MSNTMFNSSLILILMRKCHQVLCSWFHFLVIRCQQCSFAGKKRGKCKPRMQWKSKRTRNVLRVCPKASRAARLIQIYQEPTMTISAKLSLTWADRCFHSTCSQLYGSYISSFIVGWVCVHTHMCISLKDSHDLYLCAKHQELYVFYFFIIHTTIKMRWTLQVPLKR